MNPGPARKISISSQPPAPLANVRPLHLTSAFLSRHDSDENYVRRREESERALAQEVDEYLKSDRPQGEDLPPEQIRKKMRELLDALSRDYQFLDRNRFVDELCAMVDKIPGSRSKVGFIVSIFAIYEYTNHQKLAIGCADFCLEKSPGNHQLSSAYSMFLCKIADNAACAGAPQDMCRKVVEKSMEISGRFAESSFPALRTISEVSTFCRNIRLKTSEDSQPGIRIGQLPLPEPDLFSAFLLALENVCASQKDRPSAINEFLSCSIDMCKSFRAELFISTVSVLAWAAKLGQDENKRYVNEALIALQSWDQVYLSALETCLVRDRGLFPQS